MRQTLQSLFGLDLTTAQKVIVASVVILVLLALLGLFVRQIQGGRLRLRGQGGGRTRQPRLGVVDTHDLDRQRQLVLIRRDNVEHLVMIGGASDVVVETNIVRSGARAAMPIQTDLPTLDRPLPFDSLIPAAEPVRQEPVRQEPVRQEPSRHEPVDEPRKAASAATIPTQPETLPPLPPRHQAATDTAAAAAAGVGAALGTAISGAGAQQQPSFKAPAPNFARDPAPAPAVSAGELDDMARQLEEALKRPFSAVRPANVQAEPREAAARSPAPTPPAQAPKPAPEAKPAESKPVESKPAESKPAAETKPAPAPIEVPPPVIPAPPPTPFSPPSPSGSLPGDVEAELALALGLKPERSGPKPPAPVEPVQPKPTVEAEAPDEEPTFDAAAEVEEEVDESTAGSEPDRDDVAAEVKSEPEAKPEPEPETKAKTEPAPIDPFSVDAIEAEFARLLGRDPKAKS